MSDGDDQAPGWRVPVPPAAARIAWPEDFGTRFIVTVDVEEEFDWSAPFDREARSVSAIAELPAAQRRLRDGGAGLACMVDYPVAADPVAAEVMREVLGAPDASLGAQLHPWVNPPFDEAPKRANSFVANLLPSLQAAKLATLTTCLRSACGRAPIAYRAGRYGVGPQTAELLTAHGYRIDSSMRSRFNYRTEGGPDFGAIDNRAFRLGQVIELPLTTIYTGTLRRHGASLHRTARHIPRGRGLLARGGLLSRVPLTPEGVSVAEALAAIRVGLDDGLRLLVFSFHSPSLVPGLTPYVRDAADLAAFWNWWDAVLKLLATRGVRAATFEDVLAAVG